MPIGALGLHAFAVEIACGPKGTAEGKHDGALEEVPCNAGMTEEASKKVKESGHKGGERDGTFVSERGDVRRHSPLVLRQGGDCNDNGRWYHDYVKLHFDYRLLGDCRFDRNVRD